jgi:hypothetical protein
MMGIEGGVAAETLKKTTDETTIHSTSDRNIRLFPCVGFRFQGISTTLMGVDNAPKQTFGNRSDTILSRT